MKVLVFYTKKFAFKTAEQNLTDEELKIFYSDPAGIPGEGEFQDGITAFIQAEEQDEQKGLKSREKKLANHLKWVARKNGATKILLHSFAHLSGSKASLQFTAELFNGVEERLKNGGYEASQTPFGYFLDLQMDAPGFSMARVWDEL